MKNLFVLGSLCLLTFASACNSHPEEVVVPEVPVKNAFKGPTYPYDYTSEASWSNRSRWNLANVHDPTVAKDGEYYNVYHTDASYGNAHDGHGHYPYRRSKDLVSWEFLGMAFDSPPAWVKDSLN